MNKYIKNGEFNFKIDTKLYGKFETLRAGEDFFAESGDPTFPLVHWLYLQNKELTDAKEFLAGKFEYGFVWESGSVIFHDIFNAGDSCTCKYSIEGTGDNSDHQESAGLKLNFKIFRRKDLVVEEQSLLKPIERKNEFTGQKRRIDFDPDWEIKMTGNEIATAKKIESVLFGLEGTDLLSKPENSDGEYAISGPASLMVLLDAFQHHFTNRQIENTEYCLYSTEEADELIIAAKDTDAYETVLSIINNKGQMLFKTNVNWIYVW